MKWTTFAGVAAMGLLLSGCAGTDVELKGGIFDLAGISGTSAKRKDPKMANRPGLVIPPSTASLPSPGPRQALQPVATADGQAFPVNPEDAKKINTAGLVAKHKAFCEKSRQRHEAGLTPTVESSPWGACHESVLRNFSGKDLSGNKAVGG